MPRHLSRLLVLLSLLCLWLDAGAADWEKQYAFAVREDLELNHDFVVKIHVPTGNIVQSYDVLAASTRYAAADTNKQRVYFSENSTGMLMALDIHTGTVTRTFVGNTLAGVAVSPDGSRVYVANRGDDQLAILDADNLSLGPIRTVAVGDQPIGVVANSAGTVVYVANAVGNSVSAVDVRIDPPVVYTRSLVDANHNNPTPLHLALNEAGNALFVSCRSGNYIAVLNTSAVLPDYVGDVPTLTGPNGLAFNAVNNRMYTASPSMNQIIYYDTTVSPILATQIASTGANSQPFGLSIDGTGNRVLVSSDGTQENPNGGRLSSFEATTGIALWSLRTGFLRALIGNLVLEERAPSAELFMSGFEG